MDDKERNMTEQDVKFLCKWAIENGQRQLTLFAPGANNTSRKGATEERN